jgi:hypothetical protein
MSAVKGFSHERSSEAAAAAAAVAVSAPTVAEWVDAMKAVGVQRVVSMLSDSELATYAEPLPAAMEAAFGAGNYVNVNAKAPGVCRRRWQLSSSDTQQLCRGWAPCGDSKCGSVRLM